MIGPVARAMTAARPRILMFHRFGADGAHRRLGTREFDEQVRYLKTHFHPARLADVIARLSSGEPLDARTVVLTVDDGYEDFATHAYPVLARHGVPATVYAVSRFISGECWLWFDALQWITEAAPAGQYSIVLGDVTLTAELQTRESRHRLWLDAAALAVARPPAAQWEIVDALARQCSVLLPALPTPEYRAMSWDQLRALDPAIVEVGAHTLSHPILAQCPPDLQEKEIRDCRRELESALGREVRNFCYPNGMPEDFTQQSVDLVAASGYTSAVMACGGLASTSSDRYRLERLGVPEGMHMFRNAVNGVWHLKGAR